MRVTMTNLRSTTILRVYSPAAGRLSLHVGGCELAACEVTAGARITQKLANGSEYSTGTGWSANFAESVANQFPHEATCPCLPVNLRREHGNVPPAPVTDTPEIREAVEAVRVSRERRERLQEALRLAEAERDARRTGSGSRTAAKAYRAALELLDLNRYEVDACVGCVERAVRSANVYRGVTEPQIIAAARSLA